MFAYITASDIMASKTPISEIYNSNCPYQSFRITHAYNGTVMWRSRSLVHSCVNKISACLTTLLNCSLTAKQPKHNMRKFPHTRRIISSSFAKYNFLYRHWCQKCTFVLCSISNDKHINTVVHPIGHKHITEQKRGLLARCLCSGHAKLLFKQKALFLTCVSLTIVSPQPLLRCPRFPAEINDP